MKDRGMGANLVTQVLAHWTHLSDRAFRVLVRMAVTALDRPTLEAPANTYFAGRELLAMSLRGDGGSEKSRYRTVARVVAELVEAGAIVRIDGGRTGHNAVYRLTLSAVDKAAEDGSQGGEISHPQGGQFDHEQGGQISRNRVAKSATPRTQEEPIEELSEEEGVSEPPTSHPPRAQTNVIPMRRTSRAAQTLAEASARVAVQRAQHQARLASGEAP